MKLKNFKTGRVIRVNLWSLTLLLTTLLAITFINASMAADYPTKPITIIVGWSPGGSGDTVSRIVAEKVAPILGQPVTVTNKPGSSGVLGAYAALEAPADGYTIFHIGLPFVMAPLVTKGIKYRPVDDFVPINLSASAADVVAVEKKARWQTFEELFQELKQKPGVLTCGMAGYGTSGHFAAELFKMATGTKFTLVPFAGGAVVVRSVLGGHVDFGTPDLSSAAYSHLKAGTMRALAIMDEKRYKGLPDVRTMVELGHPKAICASWQGFVVRSETPQVIVKRLDKVFNEALADRAIREKLENMAFVVRNLNSDKAKDFMNKEYRKWSEVAKAAGIVPK